MTSSVKPTQLLKSQKDFDISFQPSACQTKLHLVLSKLSYNNRSAHRHRNSIDFVPIKKINRNQNSQPHLNFIKPEIFQPSSKLDRLKVKERLKNPPLFKNRLPSKTVIPKLNVLKSARDSRRKASSPVKSLVISELPENQTQKKLLMLGEVVRRKSCHCSDCGGLSKLEKKTLYLPPEPRKSVLIGQDRASSVNNNSFLESTTSPFKIEEAETRPRGISETAASSQTFEIVTRGRNHTYNGVRTLPTSDQAKTSEGPIQNQVVSSPKNQLEEIVEMSPKIHKNNKDSSLPIRINDYKSAPLQKKHYIERFSGNIKGSFKMKFKKMLNCSNIEPSVNDLSGSKSKGHSVEKPKKMTFLARNSVLISQNESLTERRSIEKLAIDLKLKEALEPNKERKNSDVGSLIRGLNKKKTLRQVSQNKPEQLPKLTNSFIFNQKSIKHVLRCYLGNDKREERLNSSRSYFDKTKIEYSSLRGLGLSEKDLTILKEKRNCSKGKRVCEDTIKSARALLKIEKDRVKKEEVRVQNEYSSERIENSKIVISMMYMTERQ